MIGVMRSEWTKLWSLRSTWTTFAVALLPAIMLGVLISSLRASQLGGGVHAAAGNPAPVLDGRLDPVAVSLRGLVLAQLVIGTFGVLAVTGEYSSGTVFTSLTAVPRRWPVVVGKVMAVASMIFLIALPACLVAFLAGQAVLSPVHLGVPLSAPGAARAVLGGAVFLAVVGLLGLGCGFACRHTAGALATLYGLMLVLPAVAAALPSPWQNRVSPFLPLNAGTALTATVHQSGVLAPSTGGAVIVAYAAVAVAAGATVLLRRDA
jgi:ABC-2 type transport system permease protein